MKKYKILIVDDQEEIRKQMRWALSKDYDLLEASNKEDAVKLVKEKKPNLVSLDITLSPTSKTGEEGMEILDEIIKLDPKIKVIMVTGNDKKENAIRAINKGAYDYYEKPVNIEEIKVIFKRALYNQKIEIENELLTQELNEKNKYHEIIGNSDKMQKVFDTINKVASSDVTVLITGESGTGKELVARALHINNSVRKDKPFIVINCGAIPENLLESELFGHEKGAFTDAYSKKIGKFEMANKGTIFLDEIGELPLGLQVKLLRFLQERIIERVGGNERIEVDVRIIAATNKELKKEIEKGAFREDLYYRLSVVTVELPPLRQRDDDVALIANYYLNRFSKENNKKLKGFSEEAINDIKSYSWPGNIRELENKIKRAVLLSNSALITKEDMGIDINNDTKNVKSLKDAKEQIEIRYIKEALKKSKGNVSKASQEIGVSRVSFYDLLKKYKISM